MSLHKMLSWTLVALWMALIFSLSHQPASQSSEMSSDITEAILSAVEKAVPDLEGNMDSAEHIVRKNAHFIIYLILGALTVNALRTSGTRHNRRTVFAIGICVLYAMSDEFHQLYVPGRSGELRDVWIDSSGAAAGVFLYMFAEKALNRNIEKAFKAKEIEN
ncbi:VanZ family protein [Planococcus shenhongbingii]|uniref:VanZ family protein n=1 Tax=Planococcus shenhongbingii TaxID=3058398 RepID=UPI002638BEFC|nr:VanZ family protein [Planococcus sp. N016]WKA57732.1 VanZ family protein [Planococcus sp. N016]